MKKRILAMLMAAALCVGSVPFSVYAEEMEKEVVTDSEADIMKNTPDEVAKQMEDVEVVTAQEDEEINVASVDEIVSANAMMEGSSSDVDSGTYDGVDWRITEDYELIIGKEGETQQLAFAALRNPDNWPWNAYSDKLTSVSFNGNVIGNGSLSCMFSGCSSLTSLDLSGLDTSKVTQMGAMFYECKSLESLDVSGFDTSNVTMMGSMFCECRSLTSLDVSGFETSNVNNMSFMFYGCNSLSNLDVSGFDTSNVTLIIDMFTHCSSLTSLDVSGFNTSKVDSLGQMFYGCRSLTSLDVSGFDTSNVTRMDGVFSGCSSLTSLDVSGFDTSNVTVMDSMFRGCSSLKNLDLSGFDMSNVSDMDDICNGCSNLETVTLPNTLKSITADMFAGCTSLEEVRFTGSEEEWNAIAGEENSSLNNVTINYNYSGEPGANDPSGGETPGNNGNGTGGKIIPEKNTSNDSGTKIKTKIANPMAVKAKTVKIKYSSLKKKKQKIKAKKAFTVSGAQGKVTYKLVSVKKAKFKKYFKVSKSGKITVKKGLKKGTYKLKVNVTAAGNANYEPLTKIVTVKIKVK